MKKTIWLALFAGLLVLAGCAGGTTEPPMEDPASDVSTDVSTDAPETRAPADPEAELPLAADGTSGYVIVRGANAPEKEVLAAEEFRKYFALVTGAELPVVTDDTPETAQEIVVGKTNREKDGEYDRAALGRDGFTIRTDGEKLWIVGGEDNGTLYAVYGFLEDYLGCRFFTPEIEKIPEMKTVSLKIAGDTQTAPFNVRTLYYTTALGNGTFAAKRKVNNSDGSISAPGVGLHSLPVLAGTGTESGGPEPCLTDENTFETVMAALRRALDSKPEANTVSVSQGDVGEEACCHCDNCMAEVEKYGWSGHYLLFVNRVAEALKADYPNVRVSTLAYNNTCEPPKGGVVAADNVLVQICTLGCRFHAFTECTEEGDFASILRGWGSACSYISIWDYTVNFRGFAAPWPNWTAIWGNMALFADNNVGTYMAQGPYTGIAGEFMDLRAYLLSLLMWEPHMTEEEYYAHMDDFLAFVYGPGWQHIRDFIDYTVKVMEDEHTTRTGFHVDELYETDPETGICTASKVLTLEQVRDYQSVDWSLYYEAGRTYVLHPFLKYGYAYFDSALAEAETDEQKWNIERARLQLDYMKSFWLYAKKTPSIDNCVKVYGDNLKNLMNQGMITAEEADALRPEFRKYITERVKEEYREFNLELIQNMVSHNAAHFIEGVANLDSREPTEWNLDGMPSHMGGGDRWY